MNVELLISDILEIKQEDFDYRMSYTCRNTKKLLKLYGKPLSEVLPIAKVCVSGYLMSKYGFDSTEGIKEKFNLSENQLRALILPYHRITFSSGSMIDTPRPKCKLETLIKHVIRVTKRKEWKENQIFQVVEI